MSGIDSWDITDGDGRTVKVAKNGVITHYLRSTVVSGKILAELTSQGTRKVRYVYANDQLLAELVPQFGVDEIFWVHENPVTSERMVNAWCGIEVRRVSHDSLGNGVENYGYANTCFASEPDPTQELMQTNWDTMYGNPYDASTGCYVDGIETSCNTASHLVNIGVGVELPPGFSANRYQTISNGSDFRLAVLHPHGDSFPGGVITYWASTVKPKWDSPRNQLLNVGTGTVLAVLTQEPAKASHDKYSGQGPQTACHIMADVAQNEANTAIYQNPNDFNAALTQFDRTFSTLYVGGPMVSFAEARRLSPGDLRTINPNEPFTGGSGFRQEYKDSGFEPHPIGGPNADQTHHFAAFLSLGINGQSAIYGYRHYLQGDNQDDLNLGKAAFRLGSQLRRHGRMSSLRQIGANIRADFCSGPGHGLYLN